MCMHSTDLAVQIAFVDIVLPGISGLDLCWCYLQRLADSSVEAIASPTVMVTCTVDLGEVELHTWGIQAPPLPPFTIRRSTLPAH